MKSIRLVTALCIFGLTACAVAGNTPVAYPTLKNPSFVISVPDSWKLTPAEEVGGYFDLEGPTGATFSFRTIEGDDDAMEQAISDLVDTANEYYSNLTMGDPLDWTPRGLTGFLMVGDGTDREDGTAMRIGMAWVALNDGTIAEVWFNCAASDSKGIAAAEKIMDSLKAP